MFEKTVKMFTSINNQVLVKILSTLGIIIVTAIVVKVFDFLLFRWQKRFFSKRERVVRGEAASLETKITIIRRMINAGIFFFAFVFFLLQFKEVRHMGAGLLASAGVAGIIIGMAAQNALSNLISGITIAFSQPVRLGDAVIFKNDFGWIEEISLIHTTIRTWDNRRIVIPNNVLANEVIENWTIRDPSLLGVVMVYVDYACDVEKIRKWVQEIVKASSYSTQERVAVVQVVDFTEKSMVLRVLAKGSDAPTTWNLRCEIREKLIGRFKEAEMPLPQIKVSSEKFKLEK